MKTFNNFIEITENSISKSEENDIINFTSPLSITDDSRQWNMTKYDIPSLDISHYDGLVTVNHGQDIADVVGKVINLRKDEQGHKVLIDGIKFAINSNPVAILARNLMRDGFVTGVSIETLGGEADQEGTWLGHKLCGLSIVAHPNNLNAYATIGNFRQAVANSIQEAQKNGLDVTKIENAAKDLEESKSIYFFNKEDYNKNMNSAKEVVKKTSTRLNSLLDKVDNAAGGGNPWHDELGRFTTGPASAIHATTIYTADNCSKGSSQYCSAASSVANALSIHKDGNLIIDGKVDSNGHPTMDESYSNSSVVISDSFTPEMASTVLTVDARASELLEKYHTPPRRTPDPVDKVIDDSIVRARRGILESGQISALQKIANAKVRAGSKMEAKKSDAADVLAMNNTMKYLNQEMNSEGAILDRRKIMKGSASLAGLTAYGGSYTNPEKLGKVRYLGRGELFTSTYNNEVRYRLASKDNRFGENQQNNIHVGTVYVSPSDGEPDVRLESGSFGADISGLKREFYDTTKEQFINAQKTVIDDYHKALDKYFRS